MHRSTLPLTRYAITQGNYDWLRYQPGGFVAGNQVTPLSGGRVVDGGAYAGWDLLNAPVPPAGASRFVQVYSGATWLTLTLNQPTELAVVWREDDPPPAWLAAWTAGGTVELNNGVWPVYRKSVGAGDVALGALWDGPGLGSSTRTPYLVLLSPTDPPQPNQACPAWLHDQWVTTGPDGRVYHTWHPQIDPESWCYYGHDHGTNPELLGINYQPLYEAVDDGTTIIGMAEPHSGFKSFGFVGDNDTRWYVTAHLGSAGPGRVCQPMHTVQLYVDDGRGHTLANVAFAGDFGRAVAFDGTDTPLTPANCPDQGHAHGGGTGVRKIPGIYNGVSSGPYEPWRMNNAMPIPAILGFDLNDLQFTTENPIAICVEYACDELLVTEERGAEVLIQFVNGVTLDAGLLSHAPGVFYTNVAGTELRSAGDPDAVEQFIAPGAFGTAQEALSKCRDVHGWGQPMICGLGNSATGDSLRELSVPHGGPN